MRTTTAASPAIGRASSSGPGSSTTSRAGSPTEGASSLEAKTSEPQRHREHREDKKREDEFLAKARRAQRRAEKPQGPLTLPRLSLRSSSLGEKLVPSPCF